MLCLLTAARHGEKSLVCKQQGKGDLPVCLGRHEVVLAPAALMLRAGLCKDALLHVCSRHTMQSNRGLFHILDHVSKGHAMGDHLRARTSTRQDVILLYPF